MGQLERSQNDLVRVVQNKTNGICTKKMLKKRFPITVWLPKYSTDDLLGDFVAGLTVGLTVIPQAIAYANIAGVPPQYGLYSSFMGAIVYTIFGSCKDITIGPTAIMSILSHEYTMGSAAIATLLCFLSGVIILAFGILNLGVLITFVSKPVISGFTSAAAITIASSQVGGLTGNKIHAEGFVELWYTFFATLNKIRWTDLSLGIACIVLLLFMKKMREFEWAKRTPEDVGLKKAFKVTIFLMSVGRNAIVVLLAAILAGALDANQPFILPDPVEGGLPSFDVPEFSTENSTFGEIMSSVGSGVIILPLISILEAIAIGSAFSQGKTLDATQEMIALGLCNIFGSFFHSIPTTGSFSRTAVNASSGVRTPAGGLTTAALVMLALAVLTPYFKYIPKAALAAVIICAVIFMIEYHDIKPIWRVRKTDQIVLWATFLISIFWKLEYGILIGVAISLVILLMGTANPKIDVISYVNDETAVPHIVVEPRAGLLYVNVDKIRALVTKKAMTDGQGRYPMVVDCRHFTMVDYSAARGIEAMTKDFVKRNQMLYFINAIPSVERAIKALSADAYIIQGSQLSDYLTTSAASPCEYTSSDTAGVERRGLKDTVEKALRRLSNSTEPDAINPLLNPEPRAQTPLNKESCT